jgi:WW domain/U1 zinc finger
MPRFFDDYSNTYLTHDSAAGRKQQRRGWKFRENFKLHYENHVEDWRKNMALASAQQAYIKAKGRDDPSIPPLPDGWKEDVDEVTGGMAFYYNDETGERTWVRPGFIPPPPPGRGGPGGGPPPMMMRGPPPPTNYRGPGGPPPPHTPNNFRGGHGGPPPGYGGPPPPPHHHHHPLPPQGVQLPQPPFPMGGGPPPLGLPPPPPPPHLQYPHPPRPGY